MTNYLTQSFKVITATHGSEALKLAELYMPDVIICDVMMPEMDGIELCNLLKNNLNTSHIPVILLSAKAEIENFVEGLETGADDYMAKPFHLPVLAAKIKSFIDNRERLKKSFTEQLYPTAKDMTTNTADEKFIDKALHVVKEHIADADFSVEDFAREMCVSRSLLHKKLTAITGLSANEFIMSLRMKKALALLNTNNTSISEIAYQVGFNDPKYFSKCFKKFYGRTPSEYFG
jgi:YesN/AraC family two-component response regulator